MKPSPNSDRQSCASLGELFPKNGTAFATESPTTFVSSRPTIFGSSRRAGIAGNLVQRPVRNGLHRQPRSLVSAGHVWVAELSATARSRREGNICKEAARSPALAHLPNARRFPSPREPLRSANRHQGTLRCRQVIAPIVGGVVAGLLAARLQQRNGWPGPQGYPHRLQRRV